MRVGPSFGRNATNGVRSEARGLLQASERNLLTAHLSSDFTDQKRESEDVSLGGAQRMTHIFIFQHNGTEMKK